MPRIRVDNVGEFGLVTDLDRQEIPNNAWTRVHNVRLRRNFATPVLGYSSIFEPAGTAHYIVGFQSGTDWYMVYPADTNSDGIAETLQAYDGTTETEITWTTGDYTAGYKWTGCIMNGVAILNNYGDCPQYWGGTGDALGLIWSGTNTWDNYDGAGAEYRAKVIRSYRNFLFALGIQEDTTEYPYTVHWSDPADPGTIPVTWDYSDPTTVSGRTDFADTPGFVIDGLALRDVFVIYKADAIWVASYVGGQFQFRFDKLSEAHGILTENCVVDIGGKHVVMGDTVVYMHDGNNIQNIMDGRTADALFSDINPGAYQNCFLAHNRTFEEVWVCYPPYGQTYPTRAFVYNYRYNTWSTRDLPSCYYIASQIVADTTKDSWPSDATGGGWETDLTRAWDEASFDPTADTPVGCGAKLWAFDSGTTADGTDFSCTLERVGLRVGEGGQKIILREVYPRLSGDNVNIRVGSVLKIDGTVLWETEYEFDAGEDIKVDATATGELHAIRFSSTGSWQWRLSGYELDLEPVGMY
jgi:hypothetical protein